MSTVPIPFLSLLRKFISEISVKNGSKRAPGRPGIFTSLVRAAAIPSLGYFFGWNSHLRLSSVSYKDEDESVNALGEENRHPEKESLKDSTNLREKNPMDNGNDKGRATPNPKGRQYDPEQPIYQLMNNPALCDPIRTPRNPIVLAHGLYGFDVRGFTGWPKVQIHYWSDVLQVLRKKVGAEVIVTRVPSTGSIQERASVMHEGLKLDAKGRQINFIAHSMGGLDCRHLISNIRPTEYTPLSLMTVCTPHRGSPFMDWLMENIGIGTLRQPLPGVTPPSPAVPLPSSIISFIDSPAYSNLTSNYLNIHFNPSTPDSPDVKYWSIGAHTNGMSFFHPLWLPKLILDGFEEKLLKQGIQSSGNDGLVTVDSARWGEFLGVLEGCDHWDIRGAGGLSAHYIEEGNEKTEVDASEESKWSWSDWQRFLGVWGEDKAKRAARDTLSDVESTRGQEKRLESANIVRALEDPDAKRRMVDEVSGQSDASKDAVKNGSSTMGNMLDWVVDNVGAVKEPIKLVVERTAAIAGSGKKSEESLKEEEKRKPPRFDLEKFYIALSRKLYDEGL